jgi:hypothetical protein
LGAFGVFKAHEGPLWTQNQFVLDCMCSPSCYVPVLSHLGLNNFFFRGYNKIYSLTMLILRIILPVWGRVGTIGKILKKGGRLFKKFSKAFFKKLNKATGQPAGRPTGHTTLVWGHFGFWKANERTLGNSNQYVLFCMCSPNCYSYITCLLGLNNLYFSG